MNPTQSQTAFLKVPCAFCHDVIDCPDDPALRDKKQMCYNCFLDRNPTDAELKEIHVEIPMDHVPDVAASQVADKMAKDVFPVIWKERLAELKDLSREEIAQELFATGVYMGVRASMEQMKESDEFDEPEQIPRWLE